MRNRVDEVFALERLRQVWKGPGDGEAVDSWRAACEVGPHERIVPCAEAAAVLARLRSAVSRSFPGTGDGVFLPLLDLVEQKLQLRFPAPGTPPVSREECLSLNDELERLLNQIEDLVEALEIGSGPV